MFDFVPTRSDGDALREYAELFRASFPDAGHLNETYLKWLYSENPSGKVVGFDAYAEGRLAAHYVTVPADVFIQGVRQRGLLSLNTATHPDFQGKGLFTELARRTYERGAELGFNFVYGVANANSTPGFIRKLGFQLVRPLDAKISLGHVAKVDWPAVCRTAAFRRQWTEAHLAWRARNPQNAIRFASNRDGVLTAFASTDKPGVVVAGEFSPDGPVTALPCASVPILPRLFIGLLPEASRRRGLAIDVPKALRPSPLNLIYLSLDQKQKTLPADQIALSFLDFDAY
ncbi:GNAT family N-acetyltransferase [Cupriavidus agavae]|uniref:Acetyltransferase (GNAT) family protein n=1 Tax=Cupriavidus agavae TaxID=1001822 RepID=A0A4Q7S6L1_9BURK|nr:GNAT family N-acetyltransferase [Cupriavidus agavae]RZT41348.1 acetyltransferase (GNAT) family protein [Cupriavidus agavae]